VNIGNNHKDEMDLLSMGILMGYLLRDIEPTIIVI
jgi:hypothetical protein